MNLYGLSKIGKLESKDIEHLETVERDGRLYYKLKMLRSITLRSSIIQNQISDIGKIKPIIREINLNGDRKRLWLGRIESVEARVSNDSMPISLDHIGKNEV